MKNVTHRVEISAKLSFRSVVIWHEIKLSFALIFILGLCNVSQFIVNL